MTDNINLNIICTVCEERNHISMIYIVDLPICDKCMIDFISEVRNMGLGTIELHIGEEE